MQKLRNERNKVTEKLLATSEEYQKEQTEKVKLLHRIDEIVAQFTEEKQEIKQRYESDITTLKQQLEEYQ